MSALGPRAYRLLLRLFPPRFRAEHGPALERLFADTHAAWGREHGRHGADFWLGVLGDAAQGAGAEWLAVARETSHPGTGGGMAEVLSSFVGDVRFALRQLARQPGLGLTVVVLMTLGVAGNTAIFRIYNGLFLRPLPFAEPSRLVDLDETAPAWDLEYVGIAYPDFVEWRASNRTFESMAVFTEGGGNLSGGGSAERVGYLSASHDLDDVLRLEPLRGRFFTAEEDQPDGPRVALLTAAFWESRFAADTAVLGSTLSLDGQTVQIIGVLPSRADFVAEADLWLPLREAPDAQSGWYLSGVGRLREGASLADAREDLLAVHKGMIPARQVNEVTSPILATLCDRHLGRYRTSSGFIMGAVGIVLLLACANIAGLIFARSIARGPEIGVRLAMGAPRPRIVRQLLTESALLAIGGAGLGAWLGVWTSNRLVGRLAQEFPRWVTFDLDARLVLFTVLLTAGSALLFGLAPALHAARRPVATLTGTGRSTTSFRHRRALSTLVSGQVALALGLLIVGGLSTLDAYRVSHADPGFATEGITVYRVQLPSSRYPDDASRVAFVESYLDRLRALPGVQGATMASNLPLIGHWGWFFHVEDAPEATEDDSNPVVLMRSVTPGYFEAMQVELLRGRAFDDFDGREDSPPVAIVNETFVRTHMADGKDPIGRRIHSGGDSDPRLTVIGLTRDIRHYGLDEPIRPGIYQPLRQVPLASFFVALRTEAAAPSPLAEARAVTTEMDAELPIYGNRTMKSVLDGSLWERRATSWLIAAFSGVALLLAVAGLYGVISYAVSQRRQEISLRMALGARAEQVRSQVVREGLAVVALGAVVGLLAALGMAGVVSGLLVQVSAREPVVYAAVTLLLLAVAGAANYLPAHRAAATDPVSALRGEHP
jgi:putative ABC transport system permease protein